MVRSISLEQDPLPNTFKSPAIEAMRKLAQSYLEMVCNRGGEEVLKVLEQARLVFSKSIHEAGGLIELVRHFRAGTPAEAAADPKRVRIGDSAQQVLRAMQYECSFRGLTVLKIFPHDLPEMDMPRDIFEMIIFQMLAQAHRAIGGQNGIITVEAQERVTLAPENLSRYLISVRVSDTGARIMPQEFESLFDPLAPGAGKSRAGFGLYAAKKLVEGHNGSMRVETSDRGTSFYAEFPA